MSTLQKWKSSSKNSILLENVLKSAVRKSLNVERFNTRSHLSKQAYSYFRKDPGFKNHQRTDFSDNRRQSLDLGVDLNKRAMRVDKKDDITHENKHAQNL